MTTKKRGSARGEWPLGAYLREARGNLSVRGAARRAGISEARWRQVEAGVQKAAGGLEIPVHPKAETVASMCRSIGADIRKGLELAGYDPDQFDHLTGVDELPESVRYDWFERLPRTDREAVLAELQRRHLDVELREAR